LAIRNLDSGAVTRCLFTWATSLILVLAILGMTAQAALIDSLGQAGVASTAHGSMPSGCKSCDTPSLTGVHCGVLCASAIALPIATISARTYLGWAYTMLPLAELIGLDAEPDNSPPK